MTEQYSPRLDDEAPDVDLGALADRYRTEVPSPAVRRLVHRHDRERGLVLEVGQRVPEYYGRRNAVVLAILGNAAVYCVVSRRHGSAYDEEPIYVGHTAVEAIERE